MVRVDVIYVSDDAELVEEFLTALRTNGIDIQVSTGQRVEECPLVALITPGMLDPQMAELAASTAASYTEVLPVSFLPGASDSLFKELSQSLVIQLGVDECARRVATIARYGGRAIVDWNNLVGRAERWRSEGNPALLPEAGISEALALMPTPPAQASDRRTVVAEFVSASQAAVSRRRRIGTSVVAGIAVMLTAVLVFAVGQAVSARLAQGRAVDEGNIATSNRLARTAIDVIDGNPDLPLLLTERAREAADTGAAREASARAAAGSWPHQSYSLGYSPVGVSAAANSPRFAVTDTDHEEIVVYDGPGGKELGRFGFSTQSGLQGGRGRLTPDGRRVMTKASNANAFKLFDVDSGEQLVGPNRWQRGDDVLLQWLDDDHVLIGRGNEVLSIDAKSGHAQVFAALPAGELVDGGSMSINREHYVVTTDRSVAVIDVGSGSTEHAIQTEVRDAAVSDDGAQVVGIRSPNAVTIDFSSDEPTATEVPVGPNVVLPLDGPYMFVGGMSGELSIVAVGVDTPIQTVRGHLSDRVRATRLSDGRVATVGQDGYLRIWSVPSADVLGRPTSLGFVRKSARLSDSTGVDVSPRESARNQIRVAADDYVAVTLLPGAARMLSAADLQTTDKWFFTGLDTDVFLSRDGTRIARVGRNRTNTFAYDTAESFWSDDGSREMPGTDLRMALAMGGPGVASVSDDGGTVVAADGHTLVTYEPNGAQPGESRFLEQRTPVALWAGSGHGKTLTDDGYLRSDAGTEVSLTLPPPDEPGPPQRIAAGDFATADDFAFVTELGDVYESKSAGVQRIGSVGPGNETFALRTSADGTRLAVVGRTGVVVVDKSNGNPAYSEPAHGQAMVTDVDFSRDSKVLYLVNELGAVHRVDLENAAVRSRPPIPREYTDEERALFERNGG
jgi:WD40 repeat protein